MHILPHLGLLELNKLRNHMQRGAVSCGEVLPRAVEPCGEQCDVDFGKQIARVTGFRKGIQLRGALGSEHCVGGFGGVAHVGGRAGNLGDGGCERGVVEGRLGRNRRLGFCGYECGKEARGIGGMVGKAGGVDASGIMGWSDDPTGSREGSARVGNLARFHNAQCVFLLAPNL